MALLAPENEGHSDDSIEHGEGDAAQHDDKVPEGEHGNEARHVERGASAVGCPLARARNAHGEEHGAEDLVENGRQVDGAVRSNVHSV